MGSKITVTFLRDYRSAATGEQFCPAGASVALPFWAVQVLRAEGVVSAAEVPLLDDAGVAAEAAATPVVTRAPAARKAAGKRAARKAAK
jgi:hypothetical protein